MVDKLLIKRGTTFRARWTLLQKQDTVKPVSGYVLGYPTLITVTGHGMPVGEIPIALLDLNELSTVNDEGTPSTLDKFRANAVKVDANTISIDIDSTDFTDYVSGGYLLYKAPKDLTDYDARMQFRASVDAEDQSIDELNLDNEGLVLGDTEGTIECVLTEAQTTDLADDTGVFSIELVAPGSPGDTSRPVEGTFDTSPDLNRP